QEPMKWPAPEQLPGQGDPPGAGPGETTTSRCSFFKFGTPRRLVAFVLIRFSGPAEDHLKLIAGMHQQLHLLTRGGITGHQPCVEQGASQFALQVLSTPAAFFGFFFEQDSLYPISGLGHPTAPCTGFAV